MNHFTFPVLNPKNVGKNLKRYRRAAGLSVEKVCEALGIQRTATVYDWERGKNIPAIDNLWAICALYNTKLDSILDNNEDTVPFLYAKSVYTYMLIYDIIMT